METISKIFTDIFGVIVVISLVVIVIALYLIPGIIAYNKQKKNATAIFILNLLLGWTFLGWIIALIWALTND